MTNSQAKRLRLLFLLSVFALFAWPSSHEPTVYSKSMTDQMNQAHMSEPRRVEPEPQTDAISNQIVRTEQLNEDANRTAGNAAEELRVEPFPYLDLGKLESVEVVATGYSAGKESTGKSPGHPQFGITYSGVKVRRADFSTIAADPRVFPMGTILYIPGYGFGVVADTGSAIKGHKLDLYFATKNQVYEQWGKKKVRVYILRKGDGKVTEAMLDTLNGLGKSVPVDKPM